MNGTKTKARVSRWRESRAQQFEDQVESIEGWLDSTEDLLEMFEETGDELIVPLRSMRGEMRTKRNDLSSKAERLRAGGPGEGGGGGSG